MLSLLPWLGWLVTLRRVQELRAERFDVGTIGGDIENSGEVG